MALGYFWTSIAFCTIAAIFILDAMGFFKRRNYFPVEGRTILITGGSQGIGKALGQLLASKGANIIIVARDISKLESAIQEIRTSARSALDQRFHYLSADLTIPTEATRVLAEATKWNKSVPPTHIFCMAGSSHPGYFLDLPVSILKSQMDVNYFSAAYMAHAACQAWLSSRNATSRIELETRHLVFISSLAAFLPMVGYSPYTPPKTALRALSESLSQELLLYSHETPICSHCVFSGTAKTPGLEAENAIKPGITKQLEESETGGGQTAEEVALEMMRGLEAGAENISCGGLLGRAMKAGMLGASRRAGFGVIDTVLSWVVGIILVFVRRDFDRKVTKWGRERMRGRGKDDVKQEGS